MGTVSITQYAKFSLQREPCQLGGTNLFQVVSRASSFHGDNQVKHSCCLFTVMFQCAEQEDKEWLNGDSITFNLSFSYFFFLYVGFPKFRRTIFFFFLGAPTSNVYIYFIIIFSLPHNYVFSFLFLYPVYKFTEAETISYFL